MTPSGTASGTASAKLSLRPSKADIWGAVNGCTGYSKMVAQIPDQPSTYADEGNAAHKLATGLIEASQSSFDPEANRKFTVGQPIDGIICTDEMFNAALVYAQDVQRIMRKTTVFGGDHIGTETRLTMPQIHEVLRGKVGHWIYDAKADILYIWDFKYGRGLVEVWENLQLICYVAGLINHLGITPVNTIFNLRIVQTRGFHKDGPVRNWRTAYGILDQHIKRMSIAAAVAMSGSAETRSGPHCKYCRARYACPSAQSAGLLAGEYSNTPVPVEMDNDSLGTYLSIMLRSKEAIDHIVTGVEAEVKTKLGKGQVIPGFILKPAKGNLDWTVPESEVENFGKTFGVEITSSKLLTPSQAKKAGVPDVIVDSISAKPNRGNKLIADDGSLARQIFTQQPSKESKP